MSKRLARAWERGAPKKTAEAPIPAPTLHTPPPGPPDQATAEEDIAPCAAGRIKGSVYARTRPARDEKTCDRTRMTVEAHRGSPNRRGREGFGWRRAHAAALPSPGSAAALLSCCSQGSEAELSEGHGVTRFMSASVTSQNLISSQVPRSSASFASKWTSRLSNLSSRQQKLHFQSSFPQKRESNTSKEFQQVLFALFLLHGVKCVCHNSF